MLCDAIRDLFWTPGAPILSQFLAVHHMWQHNWAYWASVCWTCGRITADVGKNIVICVCGCSNGLAESTVSSGKAAAVVVFPRGWLCAVAPSIFSWWLPPYPAGPQVSCWHAAQLVPVPWRLQLPVHGLPETNNKRKIVCSILPSAWKNLKTLIAPCCLVAGAILMFGICKMRWMIWVFTNCKRDHKQICIVNKHGSTMNNNKAFKVGLPWPACRRWIRWRWRWVPVMSPAPPTVPLP